jgi:hypothetical protein
MEIYLQEVLVATFMDKIRPWTKVLLDLCSGGFAATLDRCIDFLQTGVPPSTWYNLFRDSAEVPTEKFEKQGANGYESRHPKRMHCPRNDFQSTAENGGGRCSYNIYIYIIVLLKRIRNIIHTRPCTHIPLYI